MNVLKSLLSANHGSTSYAKYNMLLRHKSATQFTEKAYETLALAQCSVNPLFTIWVKESRTIHNLTMDFSDY